jgi:hypothetical protein
VFYLENYNESGFLKGEVKHIRAISGKSKSKSVIALINNQAPKIFRSNE